MKPMHVVVIVYFIGIIIGTVFFNFGIEEDNQLIDLFKRQDRT